MGTTEAANIISFEHININGINPHEKVSELNNTMGIIERMEAGVFSVVETQWNTTNPQFYKFIKQIINKKDKFAKVEFSSNLDEKYEKTWKPGGTMTGVTGRWASKVDNKGSNPMGRWSWIGLRGKK